MEEFLYKLVPYSIIILYDSFKLHIRIIIGTPTLPSTPQYYIIILLYSFLAHIQKIIESQALFPPTIPHFHYYNILLSDSYMVNLPYMTEPTPPPTPHCYIIGFFQSTYLENYRSSNPSPSNIILLYY